MSSARLKLMSGAGNTFVLVPIRRPEELQNLMLQTGQQQLSHLARLLCQKAPTPTDGAVFIFPSTTDTDFRWEFFNNDGSSAEMCGNAARCAARFAFDEKLAPQISRFDTSVGVIKAEVFNSSDTVKVWLSPIQKQVWDQTIQLAKETIHYDFINSGVPHCVIDCSDTSDFSQLRPLAQALRQPPHFQPNGANITFKKVVHKNKISSVSFERGVEDFTQACGTGAVAAAFSHFHRNPAQKTIDVKVPGGELTVNFAQINPTLTGPACYIDEWKI